MAEKEIKEDAVPAPRKLSWRWKVLLLAVPMLALILAFAGGSKDKNAKTVTAAASSAPASSSTPGAADAETKTSSATVVNCGRITAQDCAHYAADLNNFKQKEEVAALGEEKQLDCTNGRIRKNPDGTWNVCACACIPASQVGM